MAFIECVTVCIDFSDYLDCTLPSMVRVFDRVIVVTAPEDAESRQVIRRHDAVEVLSTRKNFRGEAFNLPALMNDGYAAAHKRDWVCKVDSDIYFPDDSRKIIEAVPLDRECLYGARRWFCENRTLFDRFLGEGSKNMLEPPYEDSDPDVLGFFQLFHAKAPGVASRPHPFEEDTYAGPSRTNDRIFSTFFAKRAILPLDVIHLGLDAIGTNWKGRRAPRF